MMPKLTTIHPDGTKTFKEWPDDGTRPDLHELQKCVGGLIEPVSAFLPRGSRMEAYVNEEGVLRRLADNPEGSKAVNWPVGEIDRLRGLPIENLVGPVVILEGFPTDGEIEDELEAAFERGDAEDCLMCHSVARKQTSDDGTEFWRCTACKAEYQR